MWFKPKLTEEDVQIHDLVKALLSKQETKIDIAPAEAYFILSYEAKKYYLLVDSSGIKLSHYDIYQDIRLDDSKINLIKDLIREEATDRIERKRIDIFKNSNGIIKKIITNIVCNGK